MRFAKRWVRRALGIYSPSLGMRDIAHGVDSYDARRFREENPLTAFYARMAYGVECALTRIREES